VINTSSLDRVRLLLVDVLDLGDRADQVDEATALFAAMPEFDSLAIVQVITELEESFGFEVLDEDVNADVFATVGTLSRYVDEKLAGRD
jgi:acyl carrier protein